MDLIVYKYNARLDCGGGHGVIHSQKQNGVSNSSAFLKTSESEMPNVGKEGNGAPWDEQGRGISP